MSKNAKKTHQQNKKTAQRAQQAKRVAPESVAQVAVQEPEQVEVPQTPKVVSARVLAGAMSGELFESIFKPIFASFDERRDDEPLRELVESIVTAIAMRDVYDGCRKLDDVSQRYLYYLESLMGDDACEIEQTRALCDYWRSQVFITLIRDSRFVFDLLFPDEPAAAVSAKFIDRNALIRGMKRVLACHVGGKGDECPRADLLCPQLFDLVRGISSPWIGFTPSRLFGLLNHIPDSIEDEPVENDFALAMPEHVSRMVEALRSAIEDTLIIDLVAAQHTKLFAEITSAFDDNERLPQEIVENIKKRVRFDKVYSAAFETWLAGEAVTKPLHRSSRIDIQEMNAVGAMYRVLQEANDRGLAVYLFHCYDGEQ